MTKTPAEIQIEFLKKLKKEQGKTLGAKSTKAALSSVSSGGEPKPTWQLLSSPARGEKVKAGIPEGHSLAVSKVAWGQLKDHLSKTGIRLTPGQRNKLGNWAVELILAFPPSESMNLETKSEIFQRIREWSKARGL